MESEQDNIYVAPESSLDLPAKETEIVLASRWARLGASVVDGIIMAATSLPATMLLYYSTDSTDMAEMDGPSGIRLLDMQPSLAVVILSTVIGYALFFAVNGYFIKNKGQTLGKMLLRIKMVTTEGELPLMQAWLIRYAVYFLPANVPMIGSLFSLVNILFIFRKDKRCIHDLAAGTVVVKAL